MDIPYAFFEAPHYGIFGSQLMVAEKNFDIIYEDYPGSPNQIVVRKNGDKTTKFIPTPLNYVDGKNDVNRMINKVRNLGPNVLASFFLAPNLEFDSIILSKDKDGYHADEITDGEKQAFEAKNDRRKASIKDLISEKKDEARR